MTEGNRETESKDGGGTLREKGEAREEEREINIGGRARERMNY